jgi:hypothetical protein
MATTTIELESGRVLSHDKRAPKLEISGRDGSSIRLYAPSLSSIERIALAYRGAAGAHLETASLSARPTVSELPPLDTWFQNKEPCELRAGRLEQRTNRVAQPLLRLASVGGN